MRRLLLALLLASSSALAADMHVYLDTDIDGQLNDCPNPSHSADGTANKAELIRCTDVSPNKFYCTGGGCAAWTRDCTAPNRANVANGDTVDVDGDGVGEKVYGGAQACVWNMTAAASDTCEIHAGVYKRPGARAGTDLNSPAGGTCSRSECWNAWFVALGNGPNMGTVPGTGYGTAGNPAWVRGAVKNGSTDTWDTNGNKVPDADESVTSYPAVFDGDADNDSSYWEGTSCSDATTCTGDSFYVAVFGCGHYNVSDAAFCPSSLSGGLNAVYIDDDANGTFEVGDELGPTATWVASWIGVKDIEIQHLNGGQASACSGGTRDQLGHFTFAGGNASVVGEGYFIDHIYAHANGYSLGCDEDVAPEHHMALFGDNENHYTTVPAVIRNSYIVSGNRFVINDDCGEYGECGSSKTFHDNRVVFPPTLADGTAWGTPLKSRTKYSAFIRDKSHDSLMSATQPKIFRIYNNEFIWMVAAADSRLLQQECFGSCWNQPDVSECTGLGTPYTCCTNYQQGTCERFMGPGQGQTWFYGNIVRFAGGNDSCTGAGQPWPCCTDIDNGSCPDPVMDSRWSGAFCSVDGCTGCDTVGPYASSTQNWRFYSFLNTWDTERLISGNASTADYICTGTGTLYSTRGNAWYQATTVNSETANTERQATCSGGSNPGVNCTIGDSTCTGGGTCTAVTIASTASGSTAVVNAGTGRTTWWTVGTKNVGVHAGPANYVPKAAGPLYEVANRGLCDPDGDGTAGMDYDGDGDQDTTWLDIAGNIVSCATVNTALSFGAVQPNSDGGGAVCGNGIIDPGEVCDGTNFGGQTCAIYGCAGGSLTCNSCTSISTATCTGCGTGILVGGSINSGAIIP